MINKGFVSTCLAGMMLLATIATAEATDSRYEDVPAGHPFYNDIMTLANSGHIRGYDDNTFRPDRAVTRAEAAVLISRVRALDFNGGTSSFPDVPHNHFAVQDIESAMLAGYIEGHPDGTFRPNEPLTREQMAMILHRVFPFEEGQSSFRDVPRDRYSYEAVSALSQAGITSGTSAQQFSPTDAIKREQMSAFLVRSMNWYEDFKEAEKRALYEELNTLMRELPNASQVTWADRDQIEYARYQYQRAVFENGSSSYIEIVPLLEAERELNRLKQERTAHAREAFEADVEAGRFRSDTFAYERLFSQNNNNGNRDDDGTYTFLEGKPESRILITVPHPVTHIRNNEVKLAEPYTGSLGLSLHDYTDAHVLYITKETDDVNYYHDVPFKEEMRRIVESYDIDLVLDLHGAARSRPFDVDLGTSRGALMSTENTAALMTAGMSTLNRTNF